MSKRPLNESRDRGCRRLRLVGLVAVLAVIVACGGAGAESGGALEVPERGECDLPMYSQPPADEAETPPAAPVHPGDTPQPVCPPEE